MLGNVGDPMAVTDVTTLTIAEAGAALRTRDLSPLELTEAYLRRIERLDPAVNAFITITAERALTDARRATEELLRGQYRGPLHGIPIALKDLFATAGIRTTAGAKILADWVPEEDGTSVRRLHEAGSVLLGKLNTHELAFGGTTNNPHFGPTRNPWDLERIPGGSSGGSAAAIAAGLAAGTLGTDTAGSIRTPAAMCGVVGLKPTYGRTSTAGVVAVSRLFDHVGPITRTVEDAGLMLGVIAGYDPADHGTVRIPVGDYTAELAAGVRGLRVGIPRAWFFEQRDDDVRAAMEQALAVLKSLGADLHDVDIPGVEAGFNGRRTLAVTELQHQYQAVFAARRADFGADLQAVLELPRVSGAEVVAALGATQRLTEAMRQVLEGVDVLVCPASPVPAPRIGEDTVRDGSDRPITLWLIRQTAPFNATHLPALVLPCGFTGSNLPIGLQIVGRPFDEALMLRVGYSFEQATDWHLRRHPD
ncbi:MAG: aspartyl-tRNA(Asn)/glutamyl-tRNA(Gln) amidotransferase subunit [Pseudonocardiales bacterium]|jgi:aspartyl-tRNA(Asn)/glutamyl-tRNA(Gln) amidotransferase subunit A|nr:aspartyl-tRNA(Asn)/glutamyl-tRNA(Gln) amidotransferase subunit [Pseudonocardiales bacterium]